MKTQLTPNLPNKGYSLEQLRDLFRSPRDARFETVGTFCPLDDTALKVRADGWGCPKCLAAWDFKGLHGRWLPLRSGAQEPGDERVLVTKFRVHLDWSDPSHWSGTAEDCLSCFTPTHSRDGQGRPIHQSCAEALLFEQAGLPAGQIVDERFPATTQNPNDHKEVTR